MSDSGRVLGDCPHGRNPDWCVGCLRVQVVELAGEVARLTMTLAGRDKAYALMAAGMESQCEVMDGLKQEARKLQAERDDLRRKENSWGLLDL